MAGHEFIPKLGGSLDGLTDVKISSVADNDILQYSTATSLWTNVAFATFEATFSHLNIADIGTNSHVQIDTHIASTANPHSVTLAQAGASAFTAGSIIFANGSTLTQDNANLFWDDSNNRLGIGTTSPDALLEISGPGALDGSDPTTLQISSLANGTWTDPSAACNIDFYSADASGVGAGVRSRMSMYADSTTGAGYGLAFSTDGGTGLAEVFRFDKDGRTQIGGSSFTGTGRLNVKPLAANQIGVLVQGFTAQTADLFVVEDSAAADLFTVQADGDVTIPSGDLIVGTDDLFVDNSAGRVGIGTASPGDALEIDVASNGGLTITSDTNTPTLTFEDSSDADIFDIAFNRGNNQLEFSSNTTTPILTLEKGGNVGIGTNAAGEKLEVNGRIIEQGTYANIYVAGASTAQTINTGATTKSTAFTTDGPSSNCTAAAASDKITFTKTGFYFVSCSISFQGDVTANVTWEAEVFLNGVTQPNLHCQRVTSNSSDAGNMNVSGIIDVTSAVDLDVRFSHSAGSNQDITVTHMSLNVHYLGET